MEQRGAKPSFIYNSLKELIEYAKFLIMYREYELRILNINKMQIIKKLKEMGAIMIHPEVLQRRYIFDSHNKSLRKINAWIHLRDTGRKMIELTFKKRERTRDKEITVIVDDFDKTKDFLEKIGLVAENYQENKRIRYKYENIIFDIDTWPLIKPYLEIESISKKQVLEGIRLMGFNPRDAVSIAGENLFTFYGIDIRQIKVLKF